MITSRPKVCDSLGNKIPPMIILFLVMFQPCRLMGWVAVLIGQALPDLVMYQPCGLRVAEIKFWIAFLV
jgi:hypothetical protein